MNQLKQTIQTYIKTLYATGASKDYELAYMMEQVEELARRLDQQSNSLGSKEIVFYTDWMLSEIEVIKTNTLENSIHILIHILDKLLTFKQTHESGFPKSIVDDILTQLYLRGHISKNVMVKLKSSNHKGEQLPIEALLEVLDGTIENNKLHITEPLLGVATAKERIGRVLDYYGLSYHIYKDRLKSGWDTLSAATTPKQTKKGQPITDHLGNHFDSVTNMCVYHHIEPTTYYRRRKKGWSLEESLMGR